MRARALAASSLVIAAAACGAAPEAEEPIATSRARVVGGAAGDDASSVLLLRRGQGACSGTLVAEHAVLTAAHCVTPAPPDEVFFGRDPSTGGARVRVAAAVAHPRFDPGFLKHDVALVVLADRPPAEARAARLQSQAFNEQTIAAPLRIVGFGRADADSAAPAWVKHEGMSALRAYSEDTFTLVPSPARACRGDSGGSAYLVGSNGDALAGVVSHGDSTCTEFATFARVDVYVGDFIAPTVAATAPLSGGAGAGCFYDDNCASRRCVVEGADRYCEAPPPAAAPASGCAVAVAAAIDGRATWLGAALGLVALARRRRRRGQPVA